MKKIFSKAFCFFVSILFVLSCFVVNASAGYNVESTDVLSDLSKMSDFNIKQYVKNENEDYVSLIAFHEYGYDFNGNQNDYGLYIYLYNPSGKDIANSNNNYIYLKKNDTYVRYKMLLVSYSTKSGYEHVFYKFKVNVDAGFVSSLSSTKRVYDINAFGVSYIDGTNRKNENKYLYHYTGYDSYHGSNASSASSTLYCYSKIDETVKVELFPASWKTETSDKGVNFQYEISSVYFAIPNYWLEKYGSDEDIYKGLYSITTVWNEYMTNGLITNSAALYADAVLLKDVPYSSLSEDNIPFNFHVTHGHGDVNRCFYHFSSNSLSVHNGAFSSANMIPELNNVIYSPYETFKGLSVVETMSALKTENGIYNTYSFVQDGRTYGYNKKTFTVKDGPLNDQIHSYASTHNYFWTWLTGYGQLNKDQGVTDLVDVFHRVTAADFAGESNLINANKLFVSEADYLRLRQFYNIVDEEEYTVYLLRFAVTDYYMGEAEVFQNKIISDPDYYGSDNYYFEKTIFLDFNFLDMRFENEVSQLVTLPVDSKPIDIVGTITPGPSVDNDNGVVVDLKVQWDELLDDIGLLIGIIAAAVVVFIVLKFWDSIVNFAKALKRKDNRKGK